MTSRTALVFALLLSNATHGQQPDPPLPPGHRRIGYDPRYTIASHLQPDDQVLEVVFDGIPFCCELGSVNPEAEIESLTRMADAVGLLRVTAKESALRDAGDWIMTRVTAEIEEVLKDTTDRLVAGQSVTLTERGGSVGFGHQRVIAHYPKTRSTEIGHTYLAFLTDSEEYGLMLGNQGSFEINGPKLERLRRDALPEWILDQQSLEWVKERICAYANLPGWPPRP